jgi:A/G-specific adenine glycosylase
MIKKAANTLLPQQIETFQKIIVEYYAAFGRLFPWRYHPDPYAILVSEVMLQQTQTYRVVPKYEQFLLAFPSVEILASATLREVLSVWQGLGYNRRGKYLHELACHVMQRFEGKIPSLPEQLITLPGIGAATASSIAAFAFNVPSLFIETNIRTVFIHYFFPARTEVHDKEIMPLVEQTLDRNNPRAWYYALMDYGVMLKQTVGNASRKSAHYTRQSKFEGSDRQIRGIIIRLLTEHKSMNTAELLTHIDAPAGRITSIIDELCQEKLVAKKRNIVTIF